MVNTNNLDSDAELNGDFVIAEYNDNSDNGYKEHIPRAKLQSFKNKTKNKNQ